MKVTGYNMNIYLEAENPLAAVLNIKSEVMRLDGNKEIVVRLTFRFAGDHDFKTVDVPINQPVKELIDNEA